MLDYKCSEKVEQPSRMESGAVSAPELIDVHVLERERFAREGRVKTGKQTSIGEQDRWHAHEIKLGSCRVAWQVKL